MHNYHPVIASVGPGKVEIGILLVQVADAAATEFQFLAAVPTSLCA
jgi:hypothetical protein